MATLNDAKQYYFDQQNRENKKVSFYKTVGNRRFWRENRLNQDVGAGSIAPMPTKAKMISMKKAKMAKRK